MLLIPLDSTGMPEGCPQKLDTSFIDTLSCSDGSHYARYPLKGVDFKQFWCNAAALIHHRLACTSSKKCLILFEATGRHAIVHTNDPPHPDFRLEEPTEGVFALRDWWLVSHQTKKSDIPELEGSVRKVRRTLT